MAGFDSLRDFFFNIIPGVIFLILFDYLFPLPSLLKKDYLLFLLTFGFVLGFIFDGIYVHFRNKWGINRLILCRLLSNNSLLKEFFDRSKIIIRDRLNLKKNQELKDANAIYLMDHLVSSKGFAIHLSYAVTRASFWGNFFVASFFLLFLTLFQGIINEGVVNAHMILVIFILLCVSSWLFCKQRSRFFSSVINAFAMSELYKKS